MISKIRLILEILLKKASFEKPYLERQFTAGFYVHMDIDFIGVERGLICTILQKGITSVCLQIEPNWITLHNGFYLGNHE